MPPPTEIVEDRPFSDALFARLLMFAACITSGGALLLKVYGVSEMHQSLVALMLPAGLLAMAIIAWAITTDRKSLLHAISVGVVGGLLATFAYDLIRIPVDLAGQRIFLPIRVYGIWLTDGRSSTALTDVVGWIYHFSNGISFGLMYALFMANRHPIWAVLWAMLLETIALFSPFGPIFGFNYSWQPTVIAYVAHIAYGIPLGLVVWKWADTIGWLISLRRLLYALLALTIVASGLLLLNASKAQNDAKPTILTTDGSGLSPDIIRYSSGDEISVENTAIKNTTLIINPGNRRMLSAESTTTRMTDLGPGIHQVYVEENVFPFSTFIILEPVQAMDGL